MLRDAIENPYPQSLAGFLRQAEAVAGHDTLDRLGAIRCPTLVSVAEEDALVPGAGHAYMGERPDAFNALCVEFLERGR